MVSDRSVQSRAVRYTKRLAEPGAVASVGSRGDSYDNALAGALNSLFKAELVRHRGSWRSIDDLEPAVAEYIDWFNQRRLDFAIRLIPRVEAEQKHKGSHQPPVAKPNGSTRAASRPRAQQRPVTHKILGWFTPLPTTLLKAAARSSRRRAVGARS
ncbi:IS3 family transposase [Microbacterium trichothecenolyticum]|uniref:IS3 family transposase n=1 Tax=Microbacterium trichothecenolyticum TaxID=69370 RepID=UPI0035BE6B39